MVEGCLEFAKRFREINRRDIFYLTLRSAPRNSDGSMKQHNGDMSV
jgi:hypothetical protein